MNEFPNLDKKKKERLFWQEWLLAAIEAKDYAGAAATAHFIKLAFGGHCPKDNAEEAVKNAKSGRKKGGVTATAMGAAREIIEGKEGEK